MLGVMYKGSEQPFSIEEMKVPSIGADEVLVQVKIAGICGTDVHYRRGEFQPAKIPVVLGHEGAGIVKEIGSNVFHVKVGDNVAIHYIISCGNCPACLRGRDNLCRNRLSIGSGVDGTFAEYIKIPARNAIRIPDNVRIEHGAISACAISTAFHAANVADIEKGDNVVVFGLGAVGIHAVMWAKYFGAGRIIAIDPVESKLEASEKYGADISLNPLKIDATKSILEATEGWGADVVMECSGSHSAMEQAVKAIKGKNRFSSGTLVSVGLQTKPWQVEYWGFRGGWLTVSCDHTRTELYQVLKLISLGRIDVSQSITHKVSLKQIVEGIELIESNKEHVEKVIIDLSAP